MEKHGDEIVVASLRRFLDPDAAERYPGSLRLETEHLEWSVIQAFRHLRNAVRTREKAIFRAYCHDLAKRRFRRGFRCGEVRDVLGSARESCERVPRKDPNFHGLEDARRDQVETTFRLGIDEIHDVFEELSGAFVPPER